MSEFKYERRGHDVIIVANGSVQEMAAEIGEMIRRIYSTMYRQDPFTAKAFRLLIENVVQHPKTPTWKVADLPAGGVESFFTVPHKTEGQK